MDLLIGGVATSSADFAITGIAAGTPIATMSASTNGYGLVLSSSTSTIQSLKNNTLILGGNTTGNIALMPASGNGFVGIGTTAPAYPLVLNTPDIPAGFYYYRNSNLIGTLTASNSDFEVNAFANNMRFSVPSGKIYSFVTGNVGIGTTAPTGLLQVSGIAAGNATAIFNTGNSINDLFTASSSGTPRFTITNAGAIRLAAGYGSLGNCLLSGGGTGTASYWGSCAAGGGSNWTLNTLNGTLNPNNTSLDVLFGGNSTGSAILKIAGLNTGSNTLLDVFNNGSSVFNVSANQINNNVPASFNAAGDVSMAYDLQFTNPTASYIKSYGPLYIQSGDASSNLPLVLSGSGTGSVVVNDTFVAQDTTDSTTAYQFLNASGSAVMNIDTTNQYVGIGTTSPQTQLDVVGSIRSAYAVIITTTGLGHNFRSQDGDQTVAGYDFVNNSNGLGMFRAGPDILGFTTASTERMRIDSSGSVGIGTTSPLYKLDIAGVTRTWDLIPQDITIASSSASIINSYLGFNGYTNFSGGIGTGGVDSILNSIRLTNTGNLVNIGSIQAGEMSLTRGGTFAGKADYTTGSGPSSVAIGDLNGDGKADLAVANGGGTSVSVFLNNGNGTFAGKVDYTTGSNPNSVAIGDLNGDGRADLAVANQNGGSNSVSVLLNNGNGTFAGKVDYTTGSNPYSVAIGDLNGDGRPDLAVANYSSTSVSVFLNNGNGTFAGKVDYTAGSNPESVAIGDLNGDGRPDLAVANGGSTSVSVFLNKGNGTFAPKVDYTTGSNPISVAIGDLNGDGRPDLAVANYSSTSVSVFLNNGNGTFAGKVDYTAGSNPYLVAIGDLNGDGKADLAVANWNSTSVSVFLNNGNGTFAGKVDYTTGSHPFSVAIGDLNGDGRPDLAVANNSSTSVSVFLNNSTPMFYAQASTGNIGIGTTSPLWKLQVSDSQAGTASAMIENTYQNTAGTGPCVPGTTCHVGLNIRLGNTSGGNMGTQAGFSDRFINFMIGNSKIVGKIRGNNVAGNGNSVVYDQAGGDYAEWFRKEDVNEDLPVNTLVCFTKEGNGGITKCDSTNNAIVGIISGTYGSVGNSGYEDDPSYIVVGMIGQLPVFVSTANGEIKAGDALTFSSDPGVAVKATSAGNILGHALEGYNSNGTGSVKVYLQTGWYDPNAYLTSTGSYSVTPKDNLSSNPSDFVLKNSLGETIQNVGAFSEAAIANLRTGFIDAQNISTNNLTIAGQTLKDYVASNSGQTEYDLSNDPLFQDLQAKTADLQTKMDVMSQRLDEQASVSAFLTEILQNQIGASNSADLNLNLGNVNIQSATVSADLMVLGRTTVSDLGVTGDINAGLLSIHGLEGEIDTLGSNLYLQKNGLFGVDILDGKVVIDPQGDMTVAGTVTADVVKANTFEVLGETTGTASISAGLTSVVVPVNYGSTNYNVFVTPRTLTDNQLTVTSKTAAGFTVSILTSDIKNILFDWWIVGNK